MTEFDDQQKQWLQGFVSGLEARKAADKLTNRSAASAAPSNHADALQTAAQDRTLAAGGKLVAEETAKRQRHPLDRMDEVSGRAKAGQFPKGMDVFLTKYQGLFYVAPAQDSFMCRLRIPNGILSAWQFRGLADAADAYGGGYADVTTRANLQIREIGAAQRRRPAERGAGARPHRARLGRRQHPQHHRQPDRRHRPAGTDRHAAAVQRHAPLHPQSPRDVRPAAQVQHRLRRRRARADAGGHQRHRLRRLPGARRSASSPASISTCSSAASPAISISPSRPASCSTPDECVAVAAAVVRAFVAHGDRTNRQKARLKYVLDRMGRDAFVAEVEKEYGQPAAPRRRSGDRAATDGRQARPCRRPSPEAGRPQLSRRWSLPVGRLTSEQMRGLAEISERFGSGTIRLTVWQNLLISDVADRDVGICIAAINALGLGIEASAIRRGLVACTGNAGCKFAASNTKGHALRLADYLEARVAVDLPINIHLTGCHHSCAQHYVGDIGLLAAKVDRGEDSVEGYHVYIGGGAASTAEQAMAREYREVGGLRRPAAAARAPARRLARPSRGADRILLRVRPPPRGRRPARSRRARCGARGMNAITPIPLDHPRERAVLERAARLAERLLRRLSRRQRRGSGRRPMPPPSRTRTSPGTTPRWRCPSGWSSPRIASRERQLMAAMAQLDCGQCGYLCQTYAEAVWSGTEADMGRCVPGGKETQRKLKELLAALEPQRAGAPGGSRGQGGRPVGSRDRPALATLVDAHPLNRPGSGKDVRHVVLDLSATDLTYEAGDSLGVFARKNPQLVQAVLDRVGATGEEMVAFDGEALPLRQVLLSKVDIARPSDECMMFLATRAFDGEEALKLQALASGEGPPELADADLLDLLMAFPSVMPSLPGLLKSLDRLQPRLYSIASSSKAHPREVHLTVSAVRWDSNERTRTGIGSCYLADFAKPGDVIPIFVQKSHGFGPPADDSAPAIMVGPGTGIAPFRAFLEEREARGRQGDATGCSSATRSASADFLYEDQIMDWQRRGVLHRLDLAFSRDQAEKIYVQNRMQEAAADLWQWLEEGAHFYVCGDAKRMAKDVEDTLLAIAVEQGGKSAEQAKAWLDALAKAGRYQRDVY